MPTIEDIQAMIRVAKHSVNCKTVEIWNAGLSRKDGDLICALVKGDGLELLRKTEESCEYDIYLDGVKLGQVYCAASKYDYFFDGPDTIQGLATSLAGAVQEILKMHIREGA